MVPNSCLFAKRTAVLVSGRGSNLQALLDKEGCNIRLVCSNKKTASGILKAKRYGIPSKIFSPFDFNELEAYLKEKKIQRIILLGFMRLLPASFVDSWQGRILNLHPSLLPAYPGLNSIDKSFQEKQRMGITLHTVIPEMDKGPILYQSKVYEQENLPESELSAHWGISFREHFAVRKMEDKWV